MMEKFVSEDKLAWFISLWGNESEERRSNEFSSLGKTQRDFFSLYRTLFLSRKRRCVLSSLSEEFFQLFFEWGDALEEIATLRPR